MCDAPLAMSRLPASQTAPLAREQLLWPALGAVALCALLTASGLVEPAPDVAYYAAWSRWPAAGYLDHPGAVAWPLAALPDAWLLSAVRALPLALAVVHAAILARLLHALAAPRAAALALFVSPLWLAGALLWTPDVPLLFAWHAGLLVLVTRRGLPWLVPLAALMAAAKIIGPALAACWLLAAWRAPRERAWCAAALAASLAVFTLTGLDSATFQLARAGTTASSRDVLSHLLGPLEALAGALAVIGPALGLALGAWLLRRRPDADGSANRGPENGRIARIACVCAAGASLPFVLAGFVTRVEANWLAPAGVPLLALALVLRRPPVTAWRAVARVQVGFVAVLVAWLVLGPWLALPGDPLARLRGWRAWALSVPYDGEPVVLADRYQWSATVALHRQIPLAVTFDALTAGAAVRPGALDGELGGGTTERALVIWAEREPPVEVARRWPVLCAGGAVLSAPGSAAPAVLHWASRSRGACR